MLKMRINHLLILPAVLSLLLIWLYLAGCDEHNIVEPRFSQGDNIDFTIDNEVEDTLTIDIAFPEASHIKIYILDCAGEVIATLFDGFMPAGTNSIHHNISDYEDGYYCLIFARDSMRIRKWFEIT